MSETGVCKIYDKYTAKIQCNTNKQSQRSSKRHF